MDTWSGGRQHMWPDGLADRDTDRFVVVCIVASCVSASLKLARA